MKFLKMLGLATVAAMALTAFTAGNASATALEAGGVEQNGTVTIEMSLAAGISMIIGRTDGSLANTCTTSNLAGDTETFTGTTVTGAVDSLSFSNCTRPVAVHKSGTLHIAHIAGTTDGTVTSSGAEITTGSPFGTLNCKTEAGVDIGRLTGTASGHATLDFSAVINCGFLMPSATWKGTYAVTSPTGLGVVA
ncbi:MAG: hypothetical protein M3Y75_06240 [Actinomycetota bacterium]|nr:hypothetical protein [Actinomycetota bacterium]